MIVKGQKINDRYEVRKLIGEGGMANVYLGFDTILERDVAIKVLRGDLADDEKFVRRFRREAQSASLLNHPNIVQIYDVGEDDGNFYIVMEYINGQTLKQLIKKRGKLSVPEVIDIMSQLTDGLAHAHDSYIIHRDIKPQNIMILDDGMIKITDFGIAMAINASDLTQTNSVMGSVHYLPPEQASGKGSTIKSDIYSLGIMMYEMLAGVMPFRGETAVEIAMKHLKNPMPSVRKANETVPQSVENIILKATAKNPKNRYNNVRELYDDLKTCQDKSRMDEKRITFTYPENEFDDESTKVIGSLKEEIKNKEDKKEEILEVKEIEDDEYKDKKLSKFTLTLIILVAVMVFALFSVFIVLPKLNTSKDIKVPDVSGLTVAKARERLEKTGLKVNESIKEDYTDDVEKGYVSKTSPKAGEQVKKGSTITMFKSAGNEKVKIEDYKGKDYVKVQAKLEVEGLNVLVETKVVENKKDYEGKENEIIEQSAAAGSSIAKGETITLYIPYMPKEYPNFVLENYSVKDIQKFCEENKINLSVEEEESDETPGKVIQQSRAAGADVVEGATLIIKVAKKRKVETNTNTTNQTGNSESNSESGN
ncbi:MAG: Stk1 family PASTA domain-containing Ser/Thr kinase [Bacilli bacterium]|nr:Stk1 family PASTA domain-containing Ser/Thr kinase [Bacilli bacterium]